MEGDARRRGSGDDPEGGGGASPRARFEVPDELVARVRLGDEAAFERLVRAAFTPLWAFALGFTESREEAEDIVQDVLCRVWRMGVDWRPSGSARSYLFASVRNAALTGQRRRALEARIHQQTVEEGGPERTLVDGPDVLFEGDERLDAVWREVGTFPERQRTAFHLRYEQQMPVAEVGQVLGISSKAAERLLARTVQELRTRLGATAPPRGRRGAAVASCEPELDDRGDADVPETRVTKQA